MTDRPKPFEDIFGQPSAWAGLGDSANFRLERKFKRRLHSYLKWLETRPPRITQEELAIEGVAKLLDDDTVWAIFQTMPTSLGGLGYGSRSTVFNCTTHPYDTAMGWLIRKLWHRLPKDENTMSETFEEQLGYHVHICELNYIQQKHNTKRPKAYYVEFSLDKWEQAKAEYESFMAKKAADATQTGGGEMPGGASARSEEQGRQEDPLKDGMAGVAEEQVAPLSWAQF